MSKQAKTMLLVALLFVVVGSVSSVFFFKEKMEGTLKEPAADDNDYEINGLLLYDKDAADSIAPIRDHYKQTLAINTNLDYLETQSVTRDVLADKDFIHIDASVQEDSLDLAMIRAYAETGGVVLVAPGLKNKELHQLAGIAGYRETTLSQESEATLKLHEDHLESLAELGRQFIEHDLEWGKEQITFNEIEVNDAEVLVEIVDKPVVARKAIGEGQILVFSSLFLTYSDYITGYDFVERNEKNPYFSFFHSTFNQKSIDGLLEYLSLEKYGLAFHKTQGPYGRPGLAWQNHYEVLDSIKMKEAIVWAEVLKEENQVPTISLVRGPYNWGEWYGSISVHENSGTDAQPIFVGEEVDSFYSFGTKLKNQDGTYLNLGQLEKPARSYYEDFETDFRTSPQMTDWNHDGAYDLVVGTNEGELVLMLNEEGTFKPQQSIYQGTVDLGTQLAIGLEAEKEIGTGLFLVGNKKGEVYQLTAYSKEQGFTEASLVTDQDGTPLKVDSLAAPATGDMNNDGRVDVVVGSQDGSLAIYLATAQGYQYKTTLEHSLGTHSAPTIGDYNSDGHPDILVGNQNGEIHIFVNKGDTHFVYEGLVETQRQNIYGEHTIYTGKNVVPLIVDFNNDGVKDLVTGELSFSSTYDISSAQFPYRDELDELIDYLQDNHLPILPHLYTHSYKEDALEKQEFAKHREVFNELGIPWEYVGTNQHTWRVNVDHPSQTFTNQLAENIYYNFGFKTPNNPGDPSFVPTHLWPNLWMYANDEGKKMAMSTPAPMITVFPGIHKELAQYDMPLIFFEHIENKVNQGDLVPHLKEMINEINDIRDTFNYVFLTEEQMAQAFINNVETDYQISIQSDKLVINRDTSAVSEELTGVYKETNGVKVVFSKKHPKFYTDELIQYEKDNELFVGFLTDTVELTTSKEDPQLFTVQSSNSPIEVKEQTIHIDNYGMKQIVLASDKPLTITGEKLDIQKKDSGTETYLYEITHWGEPVDITIREEDTY